MSASFTVTELPKDLLNVAGTSPAPLTDNERLDSWAQRIFAWQQTLPDAHAHAPVTTISEYVNCGIFRGRDHLIRYHIVPVYMIWVAEEDMPFSVCTQLGRKEVWHNDGASIEELMFAEWRMYMLHRRTVQAIRAGNRGPWGEQDDLDNTLMSEEDEDDDE